MGHRAADGLTSSHRAETPNDRGTEPPNGKGTETPPIPTLRSSLNLKRPPPLVRRMPILRTPRHPPTIHTLTHSPHNSLTTSHSSMAQLILKESYATSNPHIARLLVPPCRDINNVALPALRKALSQFPSSVFSCRVAGRAINSNWSKSLEHWRNTGDFIWASGHTNSPNRNHDSISLQAEIAQTGSAAVFIRFGKQSIPPTGGTPTPVKKETGVCTDNAGYCALWIVTQCIPLNAASRATWGPNWSGGGSWMYGLKGQVLIPLDWYGGSYQWPVIPTQSLVQHLATQPGTNKGHLVRAEVHSRLTALIQRLSPSTSAINTPLLEVEWANRRSEDPITERKFRQPPSRVHNNQLAAADEVVDFWLNKQVNIVLLTALEQSGKGGVMQALTYLMIKHWLSQGHADGGTQINTTGMSMLDWMRTQRRDTFTQCRAWVQHRPTRSLLRGRLPQRVSVLIDEGHIGTGNELVLHRQLLEDKLFGSPAYLRQQEIYILIVTATPSATLADVVRMGHNNAQVVCMQPGVGYSGFQQLLQSSRLIEAGDLRLRRVAKKYISTLVSRWSSAPMYHIVRVTSDLAIKNVRRYAPFGWRLIACDSTPDAIAPGIDTHRRNLLRLLNIAPTVPSIVFIKDFARCAVRLNLKYVGSMYEPVLRTVDATAHRQGLPGRSCNYYGFVHVLVFASRAVLEEAVREFATGLPGNSKDARVRYRAGNVVAHTPSMFGALVSSANKKRKLPTSAQDAPYPLVKRHQAQLMMPREADELDWLDGETVEELRDQWRQSVRPPTGVVLNTKVQDVSWRKMVPAQVYQTGENEFKAAYLPEWSADEEWVG